MKRFLIHRSEINVRLRAVHGLVLLAAVSICQAVPASGQTYEVIDPPGSTETVPQAISENGTIVGDYRDGGGAYHGFVRDQAGNYTSFDAPGAIITTPRSINASGIITGEFRDGSNRFHGFIRYSNGVIEVFDPSDVSTSSFRGTFPNSINAAGEIVGGYNASDDAEYGFLLERNGFLRKISPPCALNSSAAAINNAGEIAGNYLVSKNPCPSSDPPYEAVGYMRDRKGNFSDIRSGEDTETVEPQDINQRGDIVGSFGEDPDFHVFLYDHHGTFTDLNIADPAPGSFHINASGVITGNTGSPPFHGFVRMTTGDVIMFDPPGSTRTFATGINNRGDIIGFFSTGGNYMGFLREN